MALIEKGAKAPEFDLVDQNGDHVKTGDFEGKNILLSWHPLAFTPVCTDQMRDLERNYDYFVDHNVYPLGISIDPQPAKSAWGKVICIDNLPLLSDFKPLGKMSKDFGNFNEESSASGRAVVLIGKDGKVLWSKQYEPSELPDIEEIKEVVGKC